MKQLGLIAVGPESPVALMHVTVEGGGISAVASCVPEESTVAMIVVPSSPAKLVHAMLTSVTATNAFMAHPPWAMSVALEMKYTKRPDTKAARRMASR
jgi:hypothetical protein